MSEGDTIFHKIIAGDIPADIVYQDSDVIAFSDINPAAPTHVLIVPKKTIPRLADAAAADKQLLGHMLVVANQIAKQHGLH
ncbi:MAG: HIT domain-containing protein, partial [Bdellovibrionales bacterium]|nr:HIT domain-containing protein [Bdellovibrionales bacterium]